MEHQQGGDAVVHPMAFLRHNDALSRRKRSERASGLRQRLRCFATHSLVVTVLFATAAALLANPTRARRPRAQEAIFKPHFLGAPIRNGTLPRKK